jgi:tight adherence protein B
MIALAVTVIAAYGTYLLYTAVAFGWRGVGVAPGVADRDRPRGDRVADWMAQAGLDPVSPRQFLGVTAALAVGGGVAGYVLFGSALPALALATAAGAFPFASYRQRRQARRRRAADAWPRLIDEMRILTASAGRSIPQALFEAGRRAPAELRPAFDAAHRQWQITTDFARTLDVLKDRMADPSADAACETLLVAFEVGGADLDRRLDALAADRRRDAEDRKDARARQSGVRFARRFTLLVPLGMALAGMSVGTGRDAYQTPLGQVAVVLALALMLACWAWAGHHLRLPDEQRVFRSTGSAP